MRDLVICRRPGDEISTFGNLALANRHHPLDVIAAFGHPLKPAYQDGIDRLRESARELRMGRVELLRFADLEQSQPSVDLIASELKHACKRPGLLPLTTYRRVYTHSVHDASPLARRLAAAVGKLRREVWTIAGSGQVDLAVRINARDFGRLLQTANNVYADLIRTGTLGPTSFRSVALFQRQLGVNLYRYVSGYLNWQMDSFNYRRPWDLHKSAYEGRRYEAELRVLNEIPWKVLTEAGACEGEFTQRLLRAFPERQIVAYEPDRWFNSRLTRTVGTRCKVRRGDLRAASREPCDVLFVSSCAYYAKEPAYEWLETKAKYIVASHDLEYHSQVLDKVLQSRGFNCVHEAHLPACIERMEGIIETRWGTNIKIWVRRERATEVRTKNPRH